MSGATSAISLGAQGLGAGVSAGGAFFGAKSQKITLESTAQTAESNARIMELAAQSEILQGQREEQKSNLKYSNLKSTQKASLAANGVDISSDTAQNILTTTDTFKEIDANTINANATRGAWGYRTQGTNFANAARVARSTSKSINPWMAGATSLINSAGGVGKSLYLYNKQTADSKKNDAPQDTSAVTTDNAGAYDWADKGWKAIW